MGKITTVTRGHKTANNRHPARSDVRAVSGPSLPLMPPTHYPYQVRQYCVHKKNPMSSDWLEEQLQDLSAGSSLVLTAIVEGVELMAISYKYNYYVYFVVSLLLLVLGTLMTGNHMYSAGRTSMGIS